MKELSSVLEEITRENNLLFKSLEFRQVLLSLLFLLIGIVVVWFVFRLLKKSSILDSKTDSFWNLTHYTLPLQLFCYTGVVRLAEIPLGLNPLQLKIIHFAEGIVISISIVFLLFSFINEGYRLIVKPSALSQDELAMQYLKTIKKHIKFLALLAIVSGFVFVQNTIFSRLAVSSWWKYFSAFALIVLLWLLNLSISKFLLRITLVLKAKNENVLLSLILSAFLWPIRILILILIGYSIKSIFNFPENINYILERSIIALSVFTGFLLIYNLLSVIENKINILVERDDNLLDKTFAQMIKLLLRLVVLAVAAIYLIQVLSGKPVGTLLAGLGIGALALALAAQDTLKNLFGSIMIMADKPFEIGQRVFVDGFDGVVETVGFRSTRIRTLTGHQVTIPNDKMASTSIENIGRRPHIRRLTNIGLTYDTPPEKVEKALQIVKEILDNHEGMDSEFPPRIYFDEFNEYSLNLKMIYWFHPADYWSFMQFCENTNLKIMKAFEREGIQFAFPTSTTYLAQDDQRQLKIEVQTSRDGTLSNKIPD